MNASFIVDRPFYPLSHSLGTSSARSCSTPRPPLRGLRFVHERFIVIVGWPIYPLGHFSGYVIGTVNADMLNKTGLCMSASSSLWAGPSSRWATSPRRHRHDECRPA